MFNNKLIVAALAVVAMVDASDTMILKGVCCMEQFGETPDECLNNPCGDCLDINGRSWSNKGPTYEMYDKYTSDQCKGAVAVLGADGRYYVGGPNNAADGADAPYFQPYWMCDLLTSTYGCDEGSPEWQAVPADSLCMDMDVPNEPVGCFTGYHHLSTYTDGCQGTGIYRYDRRDCMKEGAVDPVDGGKFIAYHDIFDTGRCCCFDRGAKGQFGENVCEDTGVSDCSTDECKAKASLAGYKKCPSGSK